MVHGKTRKSGHLVASATGRATDEALRPSLSQSGRGIVAPVCARPIGSEGGRDAEAPRPPIVALVCSAGGLQALTAVLGGLPADFGAAVVVAQHQ